MGGGSMQLEARTAERPEHGGVEARGGGAWACAAEGQEAEALLDAIAAISAGGGGGESAALEEEQSTSVHVREAGDDEDTEADDDDEVDPGGEEDSESEQKGEGEREGWEASGPN